MGLCCDKDRRLNWLRSLREQCHCCCPQGMAAVVGLDGMLEIEKVCGGSTCELDITRTECCRASLVFEDDAQLSACEDVGQPASSGSAPKQHANSDGSV